MKDNIPYDEFKTIKHFLADNRYQFRLKDLFLEIAYMLGCAGRYDAAECVFRAIIAADPGDAGGLLGLGNVLLMTGRFDESESTYSEVLRETPNDPAARAFLGELHLCTGRPVTGKELLESVCLEQPDSKVGIWASGLLDFCKELENESAFIS